MVKTVIKDISFLGQKSEAATKQKFPDHLEVYDGNTEHPVRIPSNLTILATMNTSDQNVFTLDTAFQRRWNLRHIPNKFNDPHAQDIIEDSIISWGTFATVVNDLIVEISVDTTGSADKRLGAYFVKFNELRKVAFSEKVLKYLWDDAFRMDKQALFDKSFSSLEDVLSAYQSADGDPLKLILKGDVYREMVARMSHVGVSDSINGADEAQG